MSDKKNNLNPKHISGWLADYCPIAMQSDNHESLPSRCKIAKDVNEPCPVCRGWEIAEKCNGSAIRSSKINPESLPLNAVHQLDYLLQGRDILMVEDTQTNMVFLEALLTPFSAALLRAENGLVGLDQLAANDVGIILLDLGMPVMDGIDMLERMQELYPMDERKFSVLIISAFSDWASADRAIKLGAGGYLQKPYTLDRLTSEMIRVLVDKANDRIS